MKRWPTKALGSFCQTGSGATPSRKKLEYFIGGTVPWVKSGELKESIVCSTAEKITIAATTETNAHIVPKNAVLVAMYGATVGETAILGMDAATNQAVCHIIPDPNTAHFQFIWYAVKSRLDELLSKRVGGAQPNISQGIIRETIVPVPPLAEQERIVKILDEAGRLRKLRDQADNRTANLVPALFSEMFGDPEINPMGWPTSRAGELMADCDYGTSQKANEEGRGVVVLRMGNVTNTGELDLKNLKTVELPENELAKQRLRAGDVLFNRTNSRELVGKTGMWDGRMEAVAASYFIRVRFRPDVEHPQHFTTFMNLPAMKQRLAGMARGAVGQANINSKELQAIELPVPPLPLQKEFAKRVTEIRELEAKQAASRQRLESLFQSMLHRAFNGEL